MTWKKNLVRVLSGMLMLGALALTSGADLWDGAMMATAGGVGTVTTTVTTVLHHHK